MITKHSFKKEYEIDGKIQTDLLRRQFEEIDKALSTNSNIDWLDTQNEFLKNLSQVLLGYVNDVERSINDKKHNKQKYNMTDVDVWVAWVGKTNNFKMALNDLRRNTDEIQILVNKKLKSIKQTNHVIDSAKNTQINNKPKRFIIHAVFHSGNAYKNIILFSDIIKITTQDLALHYLDLYQSSLDEQLVLVNYRAMPVAKDFKIENTKMVNVETLCRKA